MKSLLPLCIFWLLKKKTWVPHKSQTYNDIIIDNLEQSRTVEGQNNGSSIMLEICLENLLISGLNFLKNSDKEWCGAKSRSRKAW